MISENRSADNTSPMRTTLWKITKILDLNVRHKVIRSSELAGTMSTSIPPHSVLCALPAATFTATSLIPKSHLPHQHYLLAYGKPGAATCFMNCSVCQHRNMSRIKCASSFLPHSFLSTAVNQSFRSSVFPITWYKDAEVTNLPVLLFRFVLCPHYL